MNTKRFGPFFVVTLVGVPCAAQPTPAFTDLGAIPNVNGSQALGVSPNGNTVVGQASITPNPQLRAFRWNGGTAIASLGVLPGGTTSIALDTSGSNIVGESTTSAGLPRAFRWSAPVMIDMGVLPGTTSSSATAVSDDGSVIVGYSGPKPFRWTAATGMVDLAQQMGITSIVSAEDISGDGMNVVGTLFYNPGPPAVARAYRWNGSAVTDLGALPGATNSTAVAVSTDGSVVVGRSPVANANHAFRWTAQDGMVDLGFLPDAILAVAHDVSGDGFTVVGTCNVGGPPEQQLHAWIWTEERGMQDLNTLLSTMGINLGTLTLNNARAIDREATVIVGDAQGGVDGSHAWVLDLRGDSDGDGLLDHWEINGIPYINDLGQDKRLHLPGADPGHKDLYVEVDSMAGMTLQSAAITLVVDAFNNAPLGNPDGTTGVRLHVLVDEPDLTHVTDWQTDGCWPTTYNTYYDAHFGTDAERTANGGAGLLFRTAKAKAYRYCIVADNSAPERIGGCAGAPSDKSVIFLGDMPLVTSQAAVFMHEFGHMIGLKHGGGDDINGKPNYPSIMNYVLAYPFDWSGEFWKLDYSRAGGLVLGHLNETSLNETVGIGSAGGPYFDFIMPFGISTPQGGRAIAFVYLDGSQTDFGNTAGTMIPDGNFDTSVVQDLNYLPSPPPGISLPGIASPGQPLQAYNDWALVVLATPSAIGPGAPAAVYPTDELTLAARDWIEQNFPIPGGPPTCYPNCDNSTGTPLLTANDFLCFINHYATQNPAANCDNSTGTPLLTANDFTCFINAYAAGCP